MRRYELMLVLRPDIADDRVQSTLDRATRTVVDNGGQIVKVSPWGRRRLAYPINTQREGSYHIVVFDAPAPALEQLEGSLRITEEAMRHLVTRIEKPAASARGAAASEETDSEADGVVLPAPPTDEEPETVEVIDESESEAAPAAIE